jgi:hypothetical protein
MEWRFDVSRINQLKKVKLILLFSCLPWGQLMMAQSPGGIPANNKMWVKADNGVTTSGTTVTQW